MGKGQLVAKFQLLTQKAESAEDLLGKIWLPDNKENTRGELDKAIPFPSPCLDMGVMSGAAAASL